MFENFSTIVPYSVKVWRELGKLLSLDKTSQIVDLVSPQLEHLSVDKFDLDQLFVALLDLLRRKWLNLLFFPAVKHLKGIDLIEKFINVKLLENLSGICIELLICSSQFKSIYFLSVNRAIGSSMVRLLTESQLQMEYFKKAGWAPLIITFSSFLKQILTWEM